MSLMELGALGEFTSSIGVIITLAYLAIQIRQNTKTAKAATYSATTGGIDELASLGLGASETLASEVLKELTSSLVARMIVPSAEWRRTQRVPCVRHP
jgi:hypothetical protein